MKHVGADEFGLPIRFVRGANSAIEMADLPISLVTTPRILDQVNPNRLISMK
jgi:hypothetical protein